MNKLPDGSDKDLQDDMKDSDSTTSSQDIDDLILETLMDEKPNG